MTDEELMQKIDEVSGDFEGQIDDLYEAVGMLIIGRLYGWEVMRIATPRRCWTFTTERFGDPKLLMPRRGKYAHKSNGLKWADRFSSVMDVVKGNTYLPSSDRKSVA